MEEIREQEQPRVVLMVLYRQGGEHYAECLPGTPHETVAKVAPVEEEDKRKLIEGLGKDRVLGSLVEAMSALLWVLAIFSPLTQLRAACKAARGVVRAGKTVQEALAAALHRAIVRPEKSEGAGQGGAGPARKRKKQLEEEQRRRVLMATLLAGTLLRSRVEVPVAADLSAADQAPAAAEPAAAAPAAPATEPAVVAEPAPQLPPDCLVPGAPLELPPGPERTPADLPGRVFVLSMQRMFHCMEAFMKLWMNGEAVSLMVQRDVYRLASASTTRLYKVESEFLLGARQAAEQEEQQRQHQAQVLACHEERERAQIVVGSVEPVGRYIKIGLMDHPSSPHVAVSQHTSQVVVAVGTGGSGKSHLGATLIEGAVMEVPGISRLGTPSGAVAFTADWQTGSYAPELLAALRPNPSEADRWSNWQHFVALPQGIKDMTLLVPAPSLAERRRELQQQIRDHGLHVEPILFHPDDLDRFGTEVLMNTSGNRAIYTQKIDEIIGDLGGRFVPAEILRALALSDLSEQQKRLAGQRINMVERNMTQQQRLGDIPRPGRLVVVDLRGRWIGRNDVMPLVVALMNAFTQSGDFPRWFMLDELNKYTREPHVMEYLMTLVREVRHRQVSLWLSGQSVDDLPDGLLPLATVVAAFQLQSEAEYRKLQRQVGAFRGVPFAEITKQAVGYARVAALRATQPEWQRSAQGVWVRPLCTEPGGRSVISGEQQAA